jgi:hypothetical protein
MFSVKRRIDGARAIPSEGRAVLRALVSLTGAVHQVFVALEELCAACEGARSAVREVVVPESAG